MEDITEAVARMVSDSAKLRKRRDEASEHDRREFCLWVTSEKAPRSAMEAFREFDHRFSQLSDRDQESVGADKVLLFLKSVNEKGRMAILPDLEDDEGAYGLTEDWSEVEWVCRQHDARRSATTRPASGGEERAASDYALPPEESSTQTGSEELDIEALVREACGLVKAQNEAEDRSIAESGRSGSGDAEEGASLHTEDGAYAEAERDWYNGTTGEGAERATLSSCGEWTAMDEAGSYGFGTWRPETSSEEAASVLEACAIGDGVATDNDVRTEAATDMTSGGAGTLPTPILGTTAAGPSARVRPRVTDDGGGKAGNRNYEEEDRSGRRRDPSTPGPETSAVAPECGHKTGEKGGGREEAWLGESTYGKDAGPGKGTYEKTEGGARSGKEEGVKNRPDRKPTRSVIRLDIRRKKGAGPDQPTPTRKRAESAELVRPSTITEERRPKRNPIGRDRSGRGWSRHDWKPRCASHNARWEPVSTRRPSRLDEYDSVGDREWEEPSTPIRETSAVADRRKTEETAGDGEESEVEVDEATNTGFRCGETDERGHEDQTESRAATTTKEEELEADAEVGTTASEGREAKHALRPAEGQETSMHPEERQRVTDDDGRVKPSRGKRGTKDGAARHQGRRHGPSAIGMSGESCLGKRRRCVENGGLRTGKRKRGVTKDVRGQAGQEGVPRDGAATSEVAEDSEAESTDAEVGEATYLFERVRGAERNTKRVMGSSKDRSTSTHSEGNIDVRGKPTEGKSGAERVGTPRCATRKGRNPACDRRDRERVRRIYEAGKGRATGSATACGRTERGGKRGHRVWRIGWSQRFGDEHRIWWIGWSRRFETIRRRWWTGRRRWFVWTGWACSKWKTKPGKPTRMLRTRLIASTENLTFFPLCFGTYRWMCG